MHPAQGTVSTRLAIRWLVREKRSEYGTSPKCRYCLGSCSCGASKYDVPVSLYARRSIRDGSQRALYFLLKEARETHSHT